LTGIKGGGGQELLPPFVFDPRTLKKRTSVRRKVKAEAKVEMRKIRSLLNHDLSLLHSLWELPSGQDGREGLKFRL
jgi:hypothetical protein